MLLSNSSEIYSQASRPAAISIVIFVKQISFLFGIMPFDFSQEDNSEGQAAHQE